MRRATPFVDRRTDLRERRSPASSDKPASGFSLHRAGGDVSPTTTPNREPDTSLHCRLAEPSPRPGEVYLFGGGPLDRLPFHYRRPALLGWFLATLTDSLA